MLMSFAWMVALDVDRTILTNDYRVLPEVRARVAETRAAGVAVVLCTARSPQSVAFILEELGSVDAAICYGGVATWYRPGVGCALPALDSPVPPALCREVILACRERNVALAAYTTDAVYTDRTDPLLDREFALTGVEGRVADLTSLDAPFAKLLAISAVERVAELSHLKSRFAERLACHFSLANYLEITHPDVSKGRALERLGTSWAVPRDRLIAIGDSENDLPMFAIAGLSIAMGNASPTVKAAANRITASNEDGGVAMALAECADEFDW
ncbi:Cof-type HAD-IIB family hydrolase [Oricola indica]|uniref:Cof-type HAD-IIB family hydrolase n=1 Tax=Oricola indica TaxID=2872591 RepID=UPI001CBC20C6|nr:Cof-type HAD-IIB family hydrolase [Oricola indica]